MVVGMELFRDKLRGFEDCYTVIGGAACDILMSEADIDFRLTKDIDMILVLEDKRGEFARTFWEFIKEGEYKCGWKNSDEMHFYRFTEPKAGYPVMIELFSRNMGYHLDGEGGIIPIHIDDDSSSLSAILLDDDFYNFMLEGRKVVAGVSILAESYIIPFKMYAWLDLKRRKEAGEHVNERDYKKHKNDVFRLLQIVNPNEKVSASGIVRESIEMFLDEMEKETIRVEQLGLMVTKEEAVEMMRKLYLSVQ